MNSNVENEINTENVVNIENLVVENHEDEDLGGFSDGEIIENGNLGEPIEEQELGERVNSGRNYHYKTSPIIDVFRGNLNHVFIKCPFCFSVGRKFYPIGKLTTRKQPYKKSRPVIHRILQSEIDHSINDEDGTFNAELYRCKNYRWENLGRFGGKIKLDISSTNWVNVNEDDPKAVYC